MSHWLLTKSEAATAEPVARQGVAVKRFVTSMGYVLTLFDKLEFDNKVPIVRLWSGIIDNQRI